MKKSKIFILCAFILLFIIGCSNGETTETTETTEATAKDDGDKITLSLAGYLPMEHLNTELLMEFKEQVEKESDGNIEIEVFPAGQLGDPTTLFGEVVDGTIDMASIALPTEHDPVYEAIYLPYLVTNYEDAEEMYSPGSPLFDILADKSGDLGLDLLGFYGAGFIGVSSVKELNNPSSFEESKKVLVRVPGYETFRVMADAFKFETMSLDYSDIYTSLETGIVDGSIGQSVNNAYREYGDAIKNYYKYNMAFEGTGFIANQEKLASLSEEDQEILKNAVKDTAEKSFKLVEEEELEAEEKLKENGVKITEFSDEELSKFKEFFREERWNEFADLVGGEENIKLLKEGSE